MPKVCLCTLLEKSKDSVVETLWSSRTSSSSVCSSSFTVRVIYNLQMERLVHQTTEYYGCTCRYLHESDSRNLETIRMTQSTYTSRQYALYIRLFLICSKWKYSTITLVFYLYSPYTYWHFWIMAFNKPATFSGAVSTYWFKNAI